MCPWVVFNLAGGGAGADQGHGVVQARASFYENLGCPECGTVADAAAPHQALCATATTPAACARLSDSLQ